MNFLFQKCHFIQCIKANTDQVAGIFDENFVSRQLTSSGAAAYYELMQSGFPLKVAISEIMRQMQTILEPRHISLGKNVCCHILFSAAGFKHNEFKIGKTEVLIRSGKSLLLDTLNYQLKYSKKELEQKFKTSFLDFMRNVLLTRLQFLGKRKFWYFYFCWIEFNVILLL